MITIDKAIMKLEATKSMLSIKNIFQKKEVRDYIIELNRGEQLFNLGVNPSGKTVGYYSEATERIVDSRPINLTVFSYKGVNKRKTKGESFFFLDTGDYFDSFKVEVSNDSFKIIANDEHANELEENYGQLLGLTNESKAKLSKFILQIIQEQKR